MLTFHGDNGRTGWDAAEPALGPAALSSFGAAWTSQSLGGAVRGQPLVVDGVHIGGIAHDVVYVATEQDTVWALDAASGHPLWGPVRIGTPVPRSSLPCGNIDPEGITGTPVADPAAGALYVVGMTTPDGGRTVGFTADALSLADGRPLHGWPVAIAPPASNGATFDARVQQERGALSLLPGGLLEVPFGGLYGDCGTYHGWVVQIPVARPTAQRSWATPSRAGAGIWTPGGLAYGAGSLWGVTGNSTVYRSGDMGDAVVRLLPSAAGLRQPAGAQGFFAPSNAVALDTSDDDLGSGGPLLLPKQPDGHANLLFTAGKQGVGYLVDRSDPGGNGKGDGVTGEALWSACLYGNCRQRQEAVFTTAAYFTAAGGAAYIVTAGRGAQPSPCTGSGGLVAWRLHTAPAPRLSVAWCGPSMGDPGSPTVSSNGGAGAVVWVLDASGGRMLAVDGATGRQLWETRVANVPRFAVPTVAGGRVYVAAGSEVAAYAPK